MADEQSHLDEADRGQDQSNDDACGHVRCDGDD